MMIILIVGSISTILAIWLGYIIIHTEDDNIDDSNRDTEN